MGIFSHINRTACEHLGRTHKQSLDYQHDLVLAQQEIREVETTWLMKVHESEDKVMEKLELGLEKFDKNLGNSLSSTFVDELCSYGSEADSVINKRILIFIK